MAEEILIAFKHEFLGNMFNKDWVNEKYDLIYNNPNNEIRESLMIHAANPEEIELQSLEGLYREFNLKEEEYAGKINRYNENFIKQNKSHIIHLAPIDSEKLITYEGVTTDKIVNLKDKSSVISFINQTCKLYEEEDKINKLVALVTSSKKAEEFILNKKGRKFLDILYFENNLLTYYKNECNELDEYTEISKDPPTSCIYYSDEIKFYTIKRINNCNIVELLYFLNEHAALEKWFPLIAESKILHSFSPTKKIYCVKSEIPIIQDRELYMYSYVFNQIKENGKIYFLSQSIDGVEFFKNDFKDRYEIENERMYSPCIVIEVTIIGKDEVDVSIFADLFHKLKFTDIQLVEVLVKQSVKKIIERFVEVMTSPKLIRKYSPKQAKHTTVFKDFYKDQLEEFLKILEDEKNTTDKVGKPDEEDAKINVENEKSKNKQIPSDNDNENEASSISEKSNKDKDAAIEIKNDSQQEDKVNNKSINQLEAEDKKDNDDKVDVDKIKIDV